MNQEQAMTYEDTIARLNGDEFFSLFEHLGAEPRWVTSNGKPSIQLIGLCHGGSHHSALFDPTTCKVNCFSECGCGMYLHTWIGKVTEEWIPENVRNHILDFFTGKGLNLMARPPREGVELGYTERPFERVENLPIVPSMESQFPDVIKRLKAKYKWDNSIETLSKTPWCRTDGIKPEILQEFDVYYCPPQGVHKTYVNGEWIECVDKMATIILPHHNVEGDIVGLYERSFDTIRREAKELYPELDKRQLATFPRAKYVPILRLPEDMDEDGKTSYSFPNSYNLYGFHKAKESIRETGKVIIFEGAKSVMLAHQWGYPYAVASHTFGAHVNHINMLLDAGARQFYLAFDKQYQDEQGEEWSLYDRKTRELAEKVWAWCEQHPEEAKGIMFYRLRDKWGGLKYKDAPVDEGAEYFAHFMEPKGAEPLVGDEAPKERKFSVDLGVNNSLDENFKLSREWIFGGGFIPGGDQLYPGAARNHGLSTRPG